MLYSSGLAEDLYISFLEDSAANPAVESVLDAIFQQGLKKQKELSENFVETIKSFHQNEYTSGHLKVLVQYLKSQGYQIEADSQLPAGENIFMMKDDGELLRDQLVHDDDEEFLQRLKQGDKSEDEIL